MTGHVFISTLLRALELHPNDCLRSRVVQNNPSRQIRQVRVTCPSCMVDTESHTKSLLQTRFCAWSMNTLHRNDRTSRSLTGSETSLESKTLEFLPRFDLRLSHVLVPTGKNGCTEIETTGHAG